MHNIEELDKLPPGVAASLAFAGAFGIIVPSMSQAWFTGPIADAGYWHSDGICSCRGALSYSEDA